MNVLWDSLDVGCKVFDRVVRSGDLAGDVRALDDVELYKLGVYLDTQRNNNKGEGVAGAVDYLVMVEKILRFDKRVEDDADGEKSQGSRKMFSGDTVAEGIEGGLRGEDFLDE